MPVLDGKPSFPFLFTDHRTCTGVGATVEIRQIECAASVQRSSVILALTGMSSLEDKRKAFEAGMDG